MISKEDYKSLIELVILHLKESDKPYTQEAIAEHLGYGRTYISSLINGKKPLNEDHFKKLKYYYPELFTKSTIVEPKNVDIINVILDKIKRLEASNSKLVSTNSRLTQIIEDKLQSADAVQQSQPAAVPMPPDLLARIIEGGLKSKYWKTFQEGDAIVSRWILTPPAPKVLRNIQNDEGNRSK